MSGCNSITFTQSSDYTKIKRESAIYYDIKNKVDAGLVNQINSTYSYIKVDQIANQPSYIKGYQIFQIFNNCDTRSFN